MAHRDSPPLAYPVMRRIGATSGQATPSPRCGAPIEPILAVPEVPDVRLCSHRVLMPRDTDVRYLLLARQTMQRSSPQ